MKKILSLILVLFTLCTAFALPTYAALPEDNAVMPLWENINAVSSEIAFTSEGIGSAEGVVVRKVGVELLEGTMTVYKNVNGGWEFVTSAYNSATRGTLGVAAPFEAVPGVEYKAVFNATAYRNGVGESIEKIVYRTCPTP